MPAALTFLDACWLDTAITAPEGRISMPRRRSVARRPVQACQGLELQLLNQSRNQYRNGSTRSATPSWFAASGIQDWSYTFLAWWISNTAQRAVGYDRSESGGRSRSFSGSRPRPIQTSWHSTEGISLQGPAIPLQWTPPDEEDGDRRCCTVWNLMAVQRSGGSRGARRRRWAWATVSTPGASGRKTRWQRERLERSRSYLLGLRRQTVPAAAHEAALASGCIWVVAVCSALPPAPSPRASRPNLPQGCHESKKASTARSVGSSCSPR